MIQQLYIRKTKTICPVCSKELEGNIILQDEMVFLNRFCLEHGEYNFLLSNNGKSYLELDDFYFNKLKKNKVKGRITNDWVFAANHCNMNCSYCAVDIEKPLFDKMSRGDIDEILKLYGKHKLTLTGGEPTLHPDIFYFFEQGKKMGITTQLASNGILLSDEEFLKKLITAGMNEIRISTESFQKEIAFKLGADKFVDNKMQALANLKKHNLKTILSPTLFKNINENHLFECIDYAFNNPFIAEISVNGFTWAGSGTSMKPEHMFMPDEIVDLIHQKYLHCSREDIFTFQKLMQLSIQLFNIRLCMNTQILIFVKDKKNLRHLSDFLNMNRIKKHLNLWSNFPNKNILIQWIVFLFMMVTSIRWNIFKLAFPIIRMIFANIFQVKIFKYPRQLLPIVINTTCSVLNADGDNIKQCMSGMLLKESNEIKYSRATELIFKIDKTKKGI